ncbi:hypothetical protein MUN81_15570 [Hymenobacter sp. 5317J-9]|uniref:hypothetical protein n=1 Tax=Hymenobacter sp. 5317J-9 TaxID=2932250 RepID=UPI001FD6B656|nr:hypothetical protein [Hymenobacter sp. 5317J-9]UOQ96655.1 hypothetical protein MUN81_15570 [Hymenobacter sp. 5317J-9]
MPELKVDLRLHSIKEDRFFIQALGGLNEESVQTATTYHIQSTISVDSETNLVNVLFDFKLQLKEPAQSKNVLLHLIAVTTFEVVNHSEVFKPVTKKGDAEVRGIPTELASMLTSTAYSTCRGILYARCAGHVFQAAVLPLLADPSVFLPKAEPVKTAQNAVKSATINHPGADSMPRG